ncbi:MAG: cytidylyltransferase domain-containing protein [Paraclostridium sordellii]
MYYIIWKNKKILAIVPARSVSKGIKCKNITDLNRKPLIIYSIEAGSKSKYINKVVVTTDGEEITKVAKEYGAEVPFLRQKHLATDTSKTIDAVTYCIGELKNQGQEYEFT